MTLSRRWVRGAVWVVLLTMGSVLARAQEIAGSISGTVTNPSGASVSGAVVTMTDVDRKHVERTVKTDKTGFYGASSLPLGNYSVTIAMKGFKTASITGLVLNANDQLKLDQKLVAGSATETVPMVVSSLHPNLENSMSEGLVTGNQLRELVLSTRNYEQLLTLQPGVTYGGSTGQLYGGVSAPQGMTDQVLFSIDGQRPTANNWTIDGADNVNRGGNPALPLANGTQPSLAQGDGNLTLLTYPSVDAISEFVTLRGTYLAEYGRNSGGQINVVTKSGTNALHGGAYEFFRNDLFNANNYFNNLTGTPRPTLRYNDFGFTLGGPVVIPRFYNRKNFYNGKNKTFFFYSQEFRRVVNYSTTTALVPTAHERAGNFTDAGPGGTPVAVCSTAATLSTGICTAYATQLTQGQISPTAQAYITDIYANVPLPNSTADAAAGLDPHTLSTNVRNIYNNMQELARIDHSLTSKIDLFYRYLHDSLPTTEANGLFMSGGLPGVQTTQTSEPGTQHIGHVTIAARPDLLLDMGYAYSSGAVLSSPVGYAATAVDAKNAPNNIAPVTTYPSTLGVVPSIAFSGAGTPTGISSAGIYTEYNRNHNGFGDITKIIRQHTLKVGITYNHYQKIESAPGNASPYPQGLFTFGNQTAPTSSAAFPAGASAPGNFDSAFASFLIGNAANGSSPGFQQGSTDAVANLNENLVELYAQDTWRASPRLTLNLGVRYSYFGQPFDDNNELSNFDPVTYSAANAETIDSNGQLCTVASQDTASTVGTTTTITTTNCLNTNSLNGYTANAIANPINGLIFGRPLPVASFNEPTGAPSTFTQGSPFGLEVGHAERHDWAPRVGFALDVFGNGKTALRGGYGISYDQSAVSMYEQEIFNNVPYISTASYGVALLDKPSGNYPLANLTPPTIYGSPVTYQTPYVQQFSVDIQQSITPTFLLDVGYFGDHGTHLLGKLDLNEAPPGIFAQKGIANNGSGFRNINLGPACTTSVTAICPSPTTDNGYSSTSINPLSPNSGDLACTGASPSTCAVNVFNVPSYCPGFVSAQCESPLNQIRPYLGYNAINADETIFNSNYNSLQVKVTKKFSGKSLVDANYTWSKGLTNAQNDFSTAAQNTYNLEPEYGRSAYDRHDVLTIDGIWELPWMRDQKGFVGRVLGGWELSGIYAVNSGLPLTATLTGGGTVDYRGQTSIYNPSLTNGGLVTDAAGLGVLGGSAAALRPNQVLDPNNGYGRMLLHRRISWFNSTAFVAPSAASLQVGNERRGAINGPGFNRMDIGAFRNFRFFHESVFQLRGEAFNVMNHTSWGDVCTNATDTGCGPYSFGQVTSARDPRILQVGGKVNF